MFQKFIDIGRKQKLNAPKSKELLKGKHLKEFKATWDTENPVLLYVSTQASLLNL
jgi:hypothetical protein